ncbi:MAG: hypothetical protein DDT37_00553 [Firmicutes bacterium]|nr:hypothetical protein [candidate division NPL-UPA2 bacterium]MBT9155586.1 hypothetical protein [candidate division NPL-UPA2 bacterium]
MFNILFLGDIVGKPGREVVRQLLSQLRSRHSVNYCIANGENAAHGTGLTREVADELLNIGVDVLTGGNHTWDKREILEFIDEYPRVLRPANYPSGVPGSGVLLTEVGSPPVPLAVVSLVGRTFMPPVDCPFQVMDRVLASLPPHCLTFVDFHAEATSEKMALAHYLDGRVAGIVGTHTHVQTADERLLPKGTAYLSDAGMCGPYNSVLGIAAAPIIRKFTTGLPVRFELAEGPKVLCGVVYRFALATQKAVAAPERILNVVT